MPLSHKQRVLKFIEKNPEFEDFFDVHEFPEHDNMDMSKCKRMTKVSASYNHNTTEDTPYGKAMRTPGWEFHKCYDDGSKTPISESEYMTMKKFNDIPSDSWIKHNWKEKTEEYEEKD